MHPNDSYLLSYFAGLRSNRREAGDAYLFVDKVSWSTQRILVYVDNLLRAKDKKLVTIDLPEHQIFVSVTRPSAGGY